MYYQPEGEAPLSKIRILHVMQVQLCLPLTPKAFCLASVRQIVPPPLCHLDAAIFADLVIALGHGMQDVGDRLASAVHVHNKRRHLQERITTLPVSGPCLYPFHYHRGLHNPCGTSGPHVHTPHLGL